MNTAAATAKLLQSCPILCDPTDSSHQAPLSLGYSRQEYWSGMPFPSPMHESAKWKWSRSVVPKQLIQLNTRKTDNPIKKWEKDFNSHFSKEDIEMSNNQMQWFDLYISWNVYFKVSEHSSSHIDKKWKKKFPKQSKWKRPKVEA